MVNSLVLALGLCAAAAIMLAAVRCELNRTFYSFKSTGLIAAVIFCMASVLAVLYSYISDGHQIGLTLRDLVYASMFFTRVSTAFLVVFSIAMAISNIALIRHEGRRLKNVYGTALGMLFLAATAVLYFLSDIMQRHLIQWGNADAKMYGTVLRIFFGLIIPYLNCMLCYFECIAAAIGISGWIAAGQHPKYDKDFIIILGCLISKSGGLLPLLKQRTNRAIRYAWEQEIACGKPVMYVPSGGQGPDEVISEGSAMALYLESHGAEESEVFAEKKSRSTWENFVFSRKLILEMKPDAKVAFATTNYHILRSGMLARKAGFRDIEAISSGTEWYFWPNGFAREIIGIMVMTRGVHIISAVVIGLLCLGNFIGFMIK